LGNALLRTGNAQEAIGHYEQALRITPDFAEAHFNLGLALEKVGRVQEAIGHYEQALRIKPDFVQAQNALARARAVQ
jgi:tetratricopeptide (TPR) repeat protein